jgi:hypothetical protein
MDIREVHMPADGAKRVLFAEDTEQENEEYQTNKCADEPLPAMYSAMNALVPFVLDRCEIAKGFGNDMTVRTVKFVPRPEGQSICVTFIKVLKDGAKLVWTTPQKAIEEDSTTMQLCNRIKTEATKWINKERLQADLLEAESTGTDGEA